MNGMAVILHNVKHPSNNVKYPGISDTFDVKMMALKQFIKHEKQLSKQYRHIATLGGQHYVPRYLCSPVPMFPEPMFPAEAPTLPLWR